MKTFSAAANSTPELLLGAAPSERIHVNKDYYNGVLQDQMTEYCTQSTSGSLFKIGYYLESCSEFSWEGCENSDPVCGEAPKITCAAPS